MRPNATSPSFPRVALPSAYTADRRIEEWVAREAEYRRLIGAQRSARDAHQGFVTRFRTVAGGLLTRAGTRLAARPPAPRLPVASG